MFYFSFNLSRLWDRRQLNFETSVFPVYLYVPSINVHNKFIQLSDMLANIWNNLLCMDVWII